MAVAEGDAPIVLRMTCSVVRYRANHVAEQRARSLRQDPETGAPVTHQTAPPCRCGLTMETAWCVPPAGHSAVGTLRTAHTHQSTGTT